MIYLPALPSDEGMKQMEKYTVDSISDGVIVLLLRKDETVKIMISQDQLPRVREGDIITAEISTGIVHGFKIEVDETMATKAIIQAKLDKLKNRPGH